jgi:hypothetical protein
VVCVVGLVGMRVFPGELIGVEADQVMHPPTGRPSATPVTNL